MTIKQAITTIAIISIIGCLTPTSSPLITIDTTEAATPIPIMGHRFTITGDFDGDGIIDTLTERFVDKADGKETHKNYVDVDYDSLLRLNAQKEKVCFVKANTSEIDSLVIADGRQHFGLMFLKNEGDLNGDSIDEVAYVIDWADFSSLNTYWIVSYRNQEWQLVYSFPVHEGMMYNDEEPEKTSFEELIDKVDDKRLLVIRWDLDRGDTISEVVEIK